MGFPTTQWTLIAAASVSGDSTARTALARMCENYRGPVLAFLKSRGHPEPDAQDFVQEFFAELLVSQAWKRAERERGRFRMFLLGVFFQGFYPNATGVFISKGGSRTTTTTGLWSVDLSNQLALVLREGEVLDGKRVEIFLISTDFTSAVSRSFNDNGQVAVRMTHTDNTTAIVKINLP